MNLNSCPSPFHMHQIIDHDTDQQYYQSFGPNPSPPSSLSCHIFFNSAHDQTGYYDNHQLYPPQHSTGDNYDYQGGSANEIKNKVDSSIKLTLWKKEDGHLWKKEDGHKSIVQNNNPVKWMSSKMRMMQKMKNPDRTTSATSMLEDQKLQSFSSLETDTSSNNSSYNNNSPLRVCSDCNTTKTPLWRSGPKGPKSLCNACGIRQRKARRAMAAAAAAAANGTTDQLPAIKIKVQHKEKIRKYGLQLKKRCRTAAGASSAIGSPSNGQKKIGFEDFLINISKNLSFHRVFPEDEKDAAILLMALSSGLVNG